MSGGPASLEVTTPGGYWNKVGKKDFFAAWLERLDRVDGPEEGIIFDIVFVPTIPPIVLYVCVVIIVVPGIVGNVLLFRLSRSREVRVYPYSLYLSAISISDSVALLANYVDSILQANGILAPLQIASIHWCRFVYIYSKTIMTVSPWLLVCFSLDRYVALVFPLKKKVLCTYRNAKVLTAVVLVLCLTTQILMSLQIVPIYINGSFACGAETGIGAIISQFELGINMIFPVFALLFLNSHSLIAVKLAIAERVKMQTLASGRNAGTSGRREGSGFQDVDLNGTRRQTRERRERTCGKKGGLEDTDQDTSTGQSGGGEVCTPGLGLQSQKQEPRNSRARSTEGHGEATERKKEAVKGDNTGDQAERGDVATAGSERGYEAVEQRTNLIQPGKEHGCNAEKERELDDKQQDTVRGQPSKGDTAKSETDEDRGLQDIQYEEDESSGATGKAGERMSGDSEDRARRPSSGGSGEAAGKEGNLGRRREDPASSQSEIRRMSRLLLSIPVFSFLCMVPYAFVITSIWLSASSKMKLKPDPFFAITEPYFRIVFTLGYAANFYLLIGTSKKYRDLASKIISQRCGRRQN